MSAADVLVVRGGAAPAKARVSTRFLASSLERVWGTSNFIVPMWRSRVS